MLQETQAAPAPDQDLLEHPDVRRDVAGAARVPGQPAHQPVLRAAAADLLGRRERRRDVQVNLKAQLEVMQLHQKVDKLAEAIAASQKKPN